MSKFKSILFLTIIALVSINIIPSFINNLVREKELENSYEDLIKEKEIISTKYDEIVEKGKEEQYYREKYDLSQDEDVLFEFPSE